jgi:hypothetical protein
MKFAVDLANLSLLDLIILREELMIGIVEADKKTYGLIIEYIDARQELVSKLERMSTSER